MTESDCGIWNGMHRTGKLSTQLHTNYSFLSEVRGQPALNGFSQFNNPKKNSQSLRFKDLNINVLASCDKPLFYKPSRSEANLSVWLRELF